MTRHTAHNSLSQLLAGGRSPATAVAHLDNGEVTWLTFADQVGRLAGELRTRPAQDWVLFCGSPYAFAVGFFALLHSEKSIIMPPNMQPGSLSEIGAITQNAVTDLDIALDGFEQLSPLEARPRQRTAFTALDPEPVRLRLYTSGSTGERKVVRKTLDQLDSEIAVLQSTWGHEWRQADVFSTVSHQHIYGLLFTVLLPLSTGRRFWDETFTAPERLADCVNAVGSGLIVSSPAYLRRFAGLTGGLLKRPDTCCIVSSGGLLPTATATAVADALGQPPLEVLGSTETGGVAWRRQSQSASKSAWQPLGGVTVNVDAPDRRLRVKSPFVSGPAGDWFVMGDCVAPADNGAFYLLGRGDRIVKIEDKRLSLTELETRLERHPFVDACAAVDLHPAEDARMAVGMIVVLSEQGRRSLAEGERSRLNNDMEAILSPFVDPVFVPKLWRYTDRLPENSQGKVSAAAARRLFDGGYDPAQVSPLELMTTREPERVEATCMVPATLRYLDGHFPDRPIVPGVVQLDWVMAYAAALLPSPLPSLRMESVKFQTPLLPHAVFNLEVRRGTGIPRVKFRLWRDTILYSSGRITAVPAGTS